MASSGTRVGPLVQIAIHAHRDPQADLARSRRRRLHDHDVGHNHPSLRDDAGDVPEAQRQHVDQPGAHLLSQLGRRLPRRVAEVFAQTALQKRIVAELQPRVEPEIAESCLLLEEGAVKAARLDASVRQNDPGAVGNGADGLAWSNDFHGRRMIPAGRLRANRTRQGVLLFLASAFC
jgi:hypothetical protein